MYGIMLCREKLHKTNFYMYRGMHIKSIEALILGRGVLGIEKWL